MSSKANCSQLCCGVVIERGAPSDTTRAPNSLLLYRLGLAPLHGCSRCFLLPSTYSRALLSHPGGITPDSSLQNRTLLPATIARGLSLANPTAYIRGKHHKEAALAPGEIMAQVRSCCTFGMSAIGPSRPTARSSRSLSVAAHVLSRRMQSSDEPKGNLEARTGKRGMTKEQPT